jgi:allantoate deiminase
VSRLTERIAELARISATPSDQGVTRESYTELYDEGLRLVEGWMREAGLATRRDAAGNLFGRLDAGSLDRPCVLVGSHLDTTLNAGPLDGVYGVLGALEAVDRLRLSGTSPGRPVEVVAITAEEPRFATGCLGSRALVGDMSADFARRLTDREGITLAEAMEQLSMDPERIPDARLPEGYADLFVELHIEQGAVLEQRGSRLGIVNAIAAPHDLRLTVTGTAAHAGTTPMGLRRDAFLGAAEIALAVEAGALESATTGRTVGTVGAVSVRPGANNIVPGHVEIEVDIRDTDLDAREAVVAELLSTAEAVCARRGLELDVKTIADDTPVSCSETVQNAVAEACAECGIEGHVMASGAYHDAMVLARKMPVGMLFVPSMGGVSHHPDEYTDPADLDLGVDVLAGTLRRLAEQAA